MPHIGLGGGSLDGAEGQDAVAAALRAGYRLIDTALYYGNERDIAEGIRLASLRREDVFICTKLLQKAHASPAKVRASLRESLKNLGTSYVDLYLIHNPRAGKILEVWPLLLALREEGLARSVGVSNFGVSQLEGMRSAGLEMPEVNQVELHCWLQQRELTEYHRAHSIATMCHAPLARCQQFGRTGLATLARQLNRPEAQLAVRWCLQRGLIPIPKSIQPERILSNAAEGFDLSAEQMDLIAELDSGYMSCKVATPCMKLPWSTLAEAIPDPALWGGRKGDKGGGKGGKGGKGRGLGPGGFAAGAASGRPF